MTPVQRETWHNSYDHGWGAGDLVEGAWSHPAKMAKGLVYRIIRTGIERGWFVPGETTLIDPFFGIGSTGIAGAAAGLQVIGIELESRFCELAQANIELHRTAWERLGCPIPVVIQGDSRELGRIVREAIMGGVTSPPFGGSGLGATSEARNRQVITAGTPTHKPDAALSVTSYGQTPGQLGRMPLGAVSSPPYANSIERPSGIDPTKFAQERFGPNTQALSSTYGATEGQIGAEKGETYWGACSVIYQQMYDLMQPGGHFALVLKPFVRNKALVDLPAMTLDLLVSQGWEPVAWVEAMLTGEGVQDSMLADVPQRQKKRASFFRRLYEKKYPGNAINCEIVIVVRRP